MANLEHLARLKEHIETWDEWRRNNPGVVPDLGKADLSRSDLRRANLGQCDLRGANLHGAILRWADLHGAILWETDLSGADLRDMYISLADFKLADLSGSDLTRSDLSVANLSAADLTEANLRETDLSLAILHGTHLSSVNLTQAVLSQTVFSDVDLSSARGLDTVRHRHPSSVAIDTIFKSRGTIPEGFLRGCGVPEQFITYARSLLGQPIQFYSCFISYSSHDQVFAEQLHTDLLAKNLRCWFAPEDLKVGDRFQECIEESIQAYDRVMIVLSEASVKSRWAEREVNAAREREDREDRTVLFPIRIDDAVMNATQPWAADIRRSRHIGDFRAWGDHSSYEKAVERLLRDLKATNRASEQPA